MSQTPWNMVSTITPSAASLPATRSATRCVRLEARYAGILLQFDGQFGSDRAADCGSSTPLFCVGLECVSGVSSCPVSWTSYTRSVSRIVAGCKIVCVCDISLEGAGLCSRRVLDRTSHFALHDVDAIWFQMAVTLSPLCT